MFLIRLTKVKESVIDFTSCFDLDCVHNTNVVWVHPKENILWPKRQGVCKCYTDRYGFTVEFLL